jgi:fructose-specific phosphotransferase system IIC component
MSTTGVLLVIAVIFGIVWIILHVVIIVQGFKTSVGWGLIALFVPLGSHVFAFSRSGRKGLAVIFLVALLGAAACGSVASYLTAKAVAAAVGASVKGMQEFDEQIQDLDKVDNIDLKL